MTVFLQMNMRVDSLAENKFFPDNVYQQLEHEPEAVGFDPWEWARKPPESSDVDAYNAYHQLNHGMRLQKMVLYRRS